MLIDPIFETEQEHGTEQEHDANTTSTKCALTRGKGAWKIMKAAKKRLTVKFVF